MPLLSGWPRIVHNLRVMGFPFVDQMNELVLTPCEMRFGLLMWLFEKYDKDWALHGEGDKMKMANFAFILGLLPANDVATIEGSFTDKAKQISFLEALTDIVAVAEKWNAKADEKCVRDVLFLETLTGERAKIFSSTPFKSSLVAQSSLPSSSSSSSSSSSVPDLGKLQQTLDNLQHSLTSLQSHYADTQNKLKQKTEVISPSKQSTPDIPDFSQVEDSAWLQSKNEKIALLKSNIDRFNTLYSNEIRHWTSKTEFVPTIPLGSQITSIGRSCEYLNTLFEAVFQLQRAYHNITTPDHKATQSKGELLLGDHVIFEIKERVGILQKTVKRLGSV